MSNALTFKDWEMISAYLDERLSPPDCKRMETRLASDPDYKKSFDEIAYTRRLLRSLPQKRAPRNFTITPSNIKVKSPVRIPWLQPALSFVSIAAVVGLVVIFAGTYLLRGAGAAKPAVYAPEMAADGYNQTAESSSTPVIINWNPIMGMGGGGGGTPDESGIYKGGIGGGPGMVVQQPAPESVEPTAEPTVGVLTAPLSTAIPESTTRTAGEGDLSSLILGLPNPEDEGKVIESESLRQSRAGLSISPQPILMIVSGVIAVLAGAAALILRRR
jgi:hypothetical protein